MRLDAPERQQLIAAMKDGFNLPQRLGDFLRDEFNRNLALIEADRPNTLGLYDYVIRVFEGEGLVLELLRRACNRLPQNSLLTTIRDRLFEKAGAPDGQYLRTCMLLRSQPFVNRRALRLEVDELARAGGARILVVDGPPKSGRTFSRWYIHHVCEILGGRCYPADLKRFIDRPPIDLVRKMATFFGWNVNEIPQQHAQATQWAEELGEWVAGRIAIQEETVWLVFDDSSTAGLQQSMREFLVYLAETATYVNQMRVVLLAFSESLTGNASVMMRKEEVQLPTRLDIRTFLADYVGLKQIAIDDDGLDFIADNIWNSLPQERERLLDELHPTIQVAIEEFTNA